MSSLYDWCEERFQVQSIADDILSKYVPAHVNIFYCFGGIVLTSFIVQAASGFALTIYYRPTVMEAYTSIEIIQSSVNIGRLLKSTRRWSPVIMFQVLLVHVMVDRSITSSSNYIIRSNRIFTSMGSSRLLGM